jgi:DnaJ family protein B protein 13
VIAGEGMPNAKQPQNKGNLIINFETEYPTHLDDQQKKLLRKAFA